MPGRAIDKPFVNLDPADPKYEEKVKLNEELKDMFIVTTYGKLIFNQVFPEHFVFFNEPDPKKALTNLRNGTPEYFFIKRGTNYKEAIAKMLEYLTSKQDDREDRNDDAIGFGAVLARDGQPDGDASGDHNTDPKKMEPTESAG